MGLFETANFVCSVNILPAIPHFSGLGCPEVHSPRAGNSRICISGGEFVGRSFAWIRSALLSAQIIKRSFFIIYELSVYRGEGKPMKLFLSLVGYKYTVSYDLIIDGN